jgi:16S rRNA (uracil1498-N3)-methyltransferase
MPRFYCPLPLQVGQALNLPAGAARHVQVLRFQPGDTLTLFNHGLGVESPGGEFEATVTHMGRSEVGVTITAHHGVEREAARRVHIALGMPANERMDWLVEKATELGMASLQPLATERTVLKLSGERAEKKQSHWQSVAVAACEQCGGNRVPPVHAVQKLEAWLAKPRTGLKLLLSLQTGSQPLSHLLSTSEQDITFLAGPEGGLSPQEEALAIAAGFTPVSLGPRVLRSETAPLTALAVLVNQGPV